MKCEECNGTGGRTLARVCPKCAGLGNVFRCPVCMVPIARVTRTETLAGETRFDATCHGQTRSFVLTKAEQCALPVYLTDAIMAIVRRVEGLFAPAEIGILPDGRKA